MMTATLTSDRLTQMSVGEIVARAPFTARIFEKYQIDYCCQGNRPFSRACQERAVDATMLAQEILQAEQEPREPDVNWMERPLIELCDHIERRHHDYLRHELPWLSEVIDKVVKAHGEKHPALAEVRRHFHILRGEMEPHMAKEEQVLFPAIRLLESTQRPRDFPFGTLANPIRCMVHEHEGSGEELEQLRRLTANFAPPPGACPTYRVMLDSLARLERDMHEHVHKENQILFPRAEALEQRLRGG